MAAAAHIRERGTNFASAIAFIHHYIPPNMIEANLAWFRDEVGAYRVHRSGESTGETGGRGITLANENAVSTTDCFRTPNFCCPRTRGPRAKKCRKYTAFSADSARGNQNYPAKIPHAHICVFYRRVSQTCCINKAKTSTYSSPRFLGPASSTVLWKRGALRGVRG